MYEKLLDFKGELFFIIYVMKLVEFIIVEFEFLIRINNIYLVNKIRVFEVKDTVIRQAMIDFQNIEHIYSVNYLEFLM